MNFKYFMWIVFLILYLWILSGQVSESFRCFPGFRICPISRKCVLSSYWCDGDNNCGDGDGADEKDCEHLVHYPCPKYKWKCNISNICLSPSEWCNGQMDCGPEDDSDEPSYCAGTCPPGFRRCTKSQRCMRPDWWCDGDNDCGDHSDEQSGCVPSLCSPGYRRCSRSKECILSKFWCDGKVDCGFVMKDDSDETSDCETGPCREGYRKCSISKRCVPLELWCNGVKDCGPNDNSDEPSDCEDFPCRPGYRRCAVSNHCVPSDWWCDGNLDCGVGDTSDESNDCEYGPCLRQGYRRCNISKLCITSEYWCDGRRNCGPQDDSDESSDCACPELNFKNGRLSSECLRYKNEACEIICNSGFLPKNGSDTITCGPYFKWLQNHDDDVCKEIPCPDVPVKNGTLSPKCLRYANQVCEFDCETGFKPRDGLPYVACGPHGRWVENMDELCEAIICPEIEMKNGTLSQTCQRFPNETCEFKCDAGFTPKDGLTNVTCGPLGKWIEDTKDICEEIGGDTDGIQTITLVAVIVVFLLVVAIIL